MESIVGSGEFSYRATEDWAELPDGWVLGEVAAVTVDRHDRVYVFHRGEHPLLVFDSDGRFLRSWGEDMFHHPHGLFLAPDDTIFCTDDGDHTVRQYSLTGDLLLTLGVAGVPSPYQGGKPFNRCTHTAMAPNGDIYVSDGYGNARIHCYSPEGTPLFSWGAPGSGPGEFNLPHNIVCDDAGFVYVADRENHRIQIFDGKGNYQGQWNNLHRPSALYLASDPDPVFYVGELGPYLTANHGWPNLGPRISILSDSGELIGRLDSRIGEASGPARFVSPHGVATDTHGTLYVGDVCFAGWPSLYPRQQPPDYLRGLHKLERVET